MEDDGGRGRSSKVHSTHLFFWATVVMVIALLPVALYLPYMLSGVSGARGSLAERAELLCDPSCLGGDREAIMTSFADDAKRGLLAGLTLEYTSTPVAHLLSLRANPSRLPVSVGRTYVLADEVVVATMERAGLVSSPIAETWLRHPFVGSNGILGETVQRDPLALFYNREDTSQAGLDAAGALTTWSSVGVTAKKLWSLKAHSPDSARSSIVCSEDLFVPLLHQNRGRLCDSSGQPVFQFEAGLAAISTIHSVLTAGGAKGDLTPTYNPIVARSFANGASSLLIARCSMLENPLFAAGRRSIASRPLPQTEGGATAVGGSTMVLTSYAGATSPESSQTTREFVLLFEHLTQRLNTPPAEYLPSSEWHSTSSELTFMGRHGSALRLAVLSALARVQSPRTALKETSRRIRQLDVR